jgi:hypothetical protein
MIRWTGKPEGVTLGVCVVDGESVAVDDIVEDMDAVPEVAVWDADTDIVCDMDGDMLGEHAVFLPDMYAPP